MAGFETGGSADQDGSLRFVPRERHWSSLKEAADMMRPHLEQHGFSDEDVYALNNLSLLAFPVPEKFRYYQATHVAGRVYRDEMNDRSGLKEVIFLAKESPHSRDTVVVDITDAEKPLWNLDRFLQPSPHEKEQERGFQIWLAEVIKDTEWFTRPAPAYSISFSYVGMPELFKPDHKYFAKWIQQVWREAQGAAENGTSVDRE